MYTFILLIATLFQVQPENEIRISTAQAISNDQLSGSAFFTKDQQNNTVLCWTAGEKGKASLYFATYNKKLEKFNEAILVAPSYGTGIHGESINKVAFKNDGTIVAVYERKHPTEKNKFAGSIFYTQSFDHGTTWTPEKYLHTDTVREYGRSYFDIATLSDGEVAAVWLDGRNKLGSDGSSLYFTKTKGKTGFVSDKQIGETVCQCCRTDLAVDAQGVIHIIYRDIESTIKGQVRDFVHVYSQDNGVTFSSIKKISDDNWVISGCPHTGASMTSINNTMGIVWFTAGGEAGLYYTQTNAQGQFTPRQLISSGGRHPQITAWNNDMLLVCEEQAMEEHGEEHSSMHHASENSLLLLLKNEAGKQTRQTIDDEGGEFPVVTAVNDHQALIAYVKNQRVVYRSVFR